MTNATMTTLSELRAQADALYRQHAEELGILRNRHAGEAEILRNRHLDESETLRQQHLAEAEAIRSRIAAQEDVDRLRWEAEELESRRVRSAEERNRRRAWDLVRRYLDDFAPLVSARFDDRGDKPHRIGGATVKPAWVFTVQDHVPDGGRSEMNLGFHRDGSWSLVGQCGAGRPALVDPHGSLHMGLRQGFVRDSFDSRKTAEVVYSIHPLDLRALIVDYLH